MKRLLLVLLLCLPSFAYAQERLTLNKLPSVDQLQSAKELIRSAETAPTKLSFGGFALIDIKLEGKLTSYVPPGSDDCIKTILIPKGQAYEGWLVNQGETQWRWTRIEPVAWDRVLVTGKKNGTATLIWMSVQNNEAVVVAAFQFVVGNVPPPAPIDPDPLPVNDALVNAALADIKAGKGTADDVANYATLYSFYASQVKNSDGTAMWGDVLAEMKTAIQKLLGSDVTKVLPNLRQAMADELTAKLPKTSIKLDDTAKASIAAELLSVSKRLQGVK